MEQLRKNFERYIKIPDKETGKGPEDFKMLAEKKGFTEKGSIKPGVKAGDIVKWLKEEFELGHGHAMAIFALLKGHKK
jgi:hypothetical protein